MSREERVKGVIRVRVYTILRKNRDGAWDGGRRVLSAGTKLCWSKWNATVSAAQQRSR